jgi:hypothetical protein
MPNIRSSDCLFALAVERFSGDPLLMSIHAVEADLRSTKKMSDALSDEVRKNQQPD